MHLKRLMNQDQLPIAFQKHDFTKLVIYLCVKRWIKKRIKNKEKWNWGSGVNLLMDVFTNTNVQRTA
ncbi:hypothetical protein BpHYR1_016651 [Brachionus plicatilis]|uniref:Uncharacterized protein n=1 Tax=Brachionus plicatilis TaxID=10195 RepID=A0A3M7RBQ5_BRAPC|nr:hypothetical protein BpHYR1_016651 [Brachionus plicatilis]